MRRKYMPVFVDCNCDGLWKRAYFSRAYVR
jgi:hypothetical protein